MLGMEAWLLQYSYVHPTAGGTLRKHFENLFHNPVCTVYLGALTCQGYTLRVAIGHGGRGMSCYMRNDTEHDLTI